ncbi:MAG TPA: winged helix DNA-binding domain-containing protein [Solirubrobacteraceae bacterium]
MLADLAMAAQTLTVKELNRATLARQMLLQRGAVGVVDGVERLAGMQAQEPKHPYIGLWTRIEGFEAGDLRAALLAREVVRATLMRSTLHLMSAAQYSALRMSMQPSMSVALRALGARSQGLDLGRVLPAARALLAGRPLAFDEIRARLQEQFPDVNDRALGYAVRTLVALVMVPAEQERWGFPRVAEFALAEDWLGTPPADADPQALVRCYLGAFGPASAADAQAWSGVGGMKKVLDAMRSELVVFADSRGRELLDLPDAPRPGKKVSAPPRFLPEFDNLVLAHDDRARIIADEHRPRVTTKNLRVRSTFLWDGFVRGTWTIETKRRVATLRLAPFSALPRSAVKQLRTEGEALLAFAAPDAADYDVQFGEPV